MPSLKDLKTRIDSVKSTRKITQAMQMVAAAKLRRAEEAAAAARPYAERFDAVLAGLASGVGENGPGLLKGTGSDQTWLLVVMTSERGLCGGFNSSIVKLAKARARKLSEAGKTVKILTVGKKGREQLRREHGDSLVGHVDLSEVKRVGYDNARDMASDIVGRFDAGEFDVAAIYFNRFESVVSQVPQELQIIPAKIGSGEDATAFDCEPGDEEILAELLPRGVATQVFAALLENGASEQGARMSAMDNATRNAGEMIDKLTIQFNRTRQAVITNELIEIISGAEAL